MSAMSIGQLSKRTRVNIETVRYYERIGVVPPAPRTAGGRRVYGEEDVKRLVFVRRGRELGFGLGDVRAMLGMVDRGDVTCDQVRAMASDHLEEVRAKIADLKRMEDTLSEVVEQCGGGVAPDCPIIEALYVGG